ncbi:unnamed protein product [Diamesa hyperborea]
MAATDNLDERMERIRIKNEELEKKHAIAQADLKTAKEEGSLVTQKVNVEDWPKQHKYDTLEFTYDVEDKDKNQSADTLGDADKKTPQPILLRSGKELKDPPPADPAFNFLRDDERGDKPAPQTPQNNERRQHFNKDRKPFNPQQQQQQQPPQQQRNNNNNRNRNDRDRRPGPGPRLSDESGNSPVNDQSPPQARNHPNNSRPRNDRPRSGQNRPEDGSNGTNGGQGRPIRAQHPRNDGNQHPRNDGNQHPRHDGPQHPRNDGNHHPRHEGNQHPRNEGNQHPRNDGNQHPKHDGSGGSHHEGGGRGGRHHEGGGGSHHEGGGRGGGSGHYQNNNNPRRQHNRQSNNSNMDRQSNITVSSDGQVRSVKLSVEKPSFGTGRVGRSRNDETGQKNSAPMGDGSIQTFDPNDVDAGQQPRNRNQQRNNNRRPYHQRQRQQPEPFIDAALMEKINSLPNTITKSSVQERLLRNKLVDDKDSESKTDDPQSPTTENVPSDTENNSEESATVEAVKEVEAVIEKAEAVVEKVEAVVVKAEADVKETPIAVTEASDAVKEEPIAVLETAVEKEIAIVPEVAQNEVQAST